MKRKRRIFALVCLVAMLYQTFCPLTALALTSGPISPDASSFEPVDTSTMVNPVTGEFVYNVPLMEVPGPEGSYPLSLSYHAGINPEQESSWVGLGWTLNPGSITRTINGFPDDWANTQASRRDYWSGGVTNVTSVGVTIPYINISADVVVVKDTYRGVGVGWNVAYGFNFGDKSGVSASIGIGSNPYSSGFSVIGGLSAAGLSLTGSLGETNSIGISTSLLSVYGYNLVGASLSTTGSGVSVNSPVESSLSNSKEGVVQTETKKSGLNLLFVRFSKMRTRYWSDETENSSIYGALNAKSFSGLLSDNSLVNDGFQLSQIAPTSMDSNPEKAQSGALPAFDTYTVTGQGVGGYMRPFLYQGSVATQNVVERDGSSPTTTVQYGNNTKVSNNLGFRFLGDFSNTLQQNYTAFSTDPNTILNSGLPFAAPSGNDANWSSGYNSTNQVLAGSKAIQFFKTDANGNVVAPNANVKFIKPVATGLDRKKHLGPIAAGTVNNGITGFTITNESGVTYHYNLPAYTYDEEIYQENTVKNNSSDLKFNRQTKNAGYAYTWHLTAVTGPDYVDRGTIGVLDEADYGYWVSFEYGKWTDEFVWRTPTEGFTNNIDQKFVTVSMGKKEIYYLNAVKTRSHTALFEKDVRKDGKSASKESFNKNWSSQNSVSTDYSNAGLYNVNSNQSLRLDHVYILKNSSIPNIGVASGGSNGLVPAGRTVSCTECEFPDNVFDKNDVNAFGRSVLESNSLRVIDFTYDYSLAKGATTSFDYSNPSNKLGKLTLKSFKIRGKGGVSVLPQTEFGYNLSTTDQKKGLATVSAGSISGTTVAYELGDLIETDEATPLFCGYIDQISQSGSTYSYVLKGGNVVGSLGSKNIRKTKNPPYEKDKYDYWGMYKSDYVYYFNQNLSRNPTSISNKSTDVWSLRTIKTAGGPLVEIGFEGHDFGESVYSNNMSVQFTQMTKLSARNYRLTMSNNGRACKDMYQVGDNILAVFYREYYQKNPDPNMGSRVIKTVDPNSTANIGILAVDPIDPNSTKMYDAYMGSTVLVKALNGNTMDVELADYLEDNLFNVYYTDRSNTKVLDLNLRPTAMDKNFVGGNGVRVSSVTLKSLDGIKYINEYFYRKENPLVSSGVTAYEPLNYERYQGAAPAAAANELSFNATLNIGFSTISYYGPELAGPGVMYSRVENISKIIYPDGANGAPLTKSVMEFFTFKDAKIDKNYATSPSSSSTYSIENHVLRKFMGLMGSPKSMSYYDGNGKLTKRTVKQYLHDGITGDFFAGYKTKLQGFGYQGLISERFSEVKKVLNTGNNTWKTMGTMIAREEYPLVNIGTVEYDYIHNTKTSTKINAFDFYSGAVTESISSDSYGNSFLSQNTPAYRDFAAMGPSQLDATKKNMLTQLSASNVYRLNASGNKEYLVSAKYSLWSNGGTILNENGDPVIQNNLAVNGDVWRQTVGYVWMPSSASANGMTALASFAAFPGSNPASANTAWKRNSEAILVDPYSHVLTTRDFKNNYASTRYGYTNAKEVMSGTFAKYGEIAFSGGEDENISNSKKLEVKKGTGTVSNAVFHTGKQSIQLAAGQTGFDYSVPTTELTAGRTYTASVWVNSGSANNVKLYYQLDGTDKAVSTASNVSARSSGSWTLITFDITLSGGTTVRVFAKNDGTGTTYVDDFRFHPKNSVCTASVYDTFTGELTYSLDKNNLYTRYEYNAMGQVVATYREQFGRTPYKVSETQLNYSTRSFNGLPN
ncbi:hypothetical protein [Sphingobacterium siyangense]|uniref:hypothetical protein n=1 Tax=Sphingobacterium siyangense TaxID=459529 RepID=UPI003DA62305